uniref:Uncharacterized protein n=1 Tax=Salvator merianae TaxID=96440 RepID=A0A8D0BXW3_SALMN
MAVMAAGVGVVQNLSGEATCPICLDYFRDPVMIPECGHNLCRGCLDRCCGSATEGSCPQCRQTFHWGNMPNRLLANIVEMVKKLHLHEAEENEGVCEQHGEPKKLFCGNDKTLICVTCKQRDHRGHESLLLEDAAPEYVSQIRNCLEAHREEKEKMLERKRDTQRKGQDLLVSVAVTGRKKAIWSRKVSCEAAAAYVAPCQDAHKT